MRYMQALAALTLAPALVAPGIAAAQMSSDDSKRAWIACDDAALDADFPNAGWPNEEARARVVHQFGGAREGEDLIIISAKTNTGTVYCMLDLDYEVLLYKFDGREIIDRM